MKRPLCLLRRFSRRGVAAIWALVVLSVLSIFLATMASQLMAGRHLLDRRHDEVQALWLARAGIELAAERLLTNPADYKGESVELIPGAQVRIDVHGEGAAADTFVVTSEAHYPASSPTGVVQSLTRRFRRHTDKDKVHLELVGPAAPVKPKESDKPQKPGP